MIRTARIDIYRCEVRFLIETSEEEWAECCQENNIDDKTREDVLAEIKDEKNDGAVIPGLSPIVFIRDRNSPNIVSHEIFHAAHNILRDRGIPLDDEHGEAYAYLIGFLSEKFYEEKENVAEQE